jgi:ribosomal protein L11 methyltransferase
VKAFRVCVRDEEEDLASSLLWDAGTQGIEIRNEAGQTRLLAYFDGPIELQALQDALAGIRDATAEAVEVPSVDWVARFRENFRGFSAGPFWIAPAWDVPAGRRDVIVVDPGRAFGTGTHESTRLCLAALASLAAQRPLGRLLDVGTGTGILAIAALMLGARKAIGVDVDAESMESARLHGRLNGAEPAILLGDGAAAFRREAFDTVVANVSAPVLRGRSSELGRVMSQGGSLVLSGLLADDVDAIVAEYGELGDVAVTRDGEWAAVVVRRPT